MIVSPGSTDVKTYYMMRLTAGGTAATGLTPANFDLQYTRSGATAAAKVDATLNGNGVGGAHSDNTVIEVNATSSPGLYRVDWPDAAFAAGVPEVICTVTVATAFAEPLRVELSTLPAKLLAYIQLLARADEAIETDNATELAEINADGGSGPGDYMNDQDSLEAILQRGNQAWLTGAGAGATESYTEDTNWNRNGFDDDGGVASDTLSVNGTTFSTGELNSGVFLQVDVEFTVTLGEVAETLDVWGNYDGGSSHSIRVMALDTVSALYEDIGSMENEDSVSKHAFGFSPGHTDGTTVKVRFLHKAVAAGGPSHALHIDKAQVNTITPATPAPSESSIADAVWDELETGHTSAGKAGRQLWTILNAVNTVEPDPAGTAADLHVTTDGLVNGVGVLTTAVAALVNGLKDFDPDEDAVATVTLVTTTTTVADNVTTDAASRTASKADVGGALEAIHLHHLFAEEYDPASPPGVATALLNELIEDNGSGVSRYTVIALSRASGGITYVLPAVSSPSSSGRIDPVSLTGYQHTRLRFTIILTDSNDDTPIDVSGVVVLFKAWDKDDPATALIEMTTDGAGAELTVGGDDSNEVTADGAVTHTATARQLDWGIFDGDDAVKLGSGVLKIEEGPDLA